MIDYKMKKEHCLIKPGDRANTCPKNEHCWIKPDSKCYIIKSGNIIERKYYLIKASYWLEKNTIQ